MNRLKIILKIDFQTIFKQSIKSKKINQVYCTIIRSLLSKPHLKLKKESQNY